MDTRVFKTIRVCTTNIKLNNKLQIVCLIGGYGITVIISVEFLIYLFFSLSCPVSCKRIYILVARARIYSQGKYISFKKKTPTFFIFYDLFNRRVFENAIIRALYHGPVRTVYVCIKHIYVCRTYT